MMLTNLTYLRFSIFALLLISLPGCEPRTAVDYNRRGVAWFAEGDNEKAVADFTKAIRIDPELVEVYKQRGLAYEKLGSSDQARRDLQKAEQLEATAD